MNSDGSECKFTMHDEQKQADKVKYSCNWNREDLEEQEQGSKHEKYGYGETFIYFFPEFGYFSGFGFYQQAPYIKRQQKQR